MSVPVRYEISRDELVPVTQDWVDKAQRYFGALGAARAAARKAIETGQAPVELQQFIGAWQPEFGQRSSA